MNRMMLCLVLLMLAGVFAGAETPVYPEKSTVEGDRIEEFFNRVPELQHDRADRWPMIMWEGISLEPQPVEVYEKLLKRGLTQHVRMDPDMIPVALTLQEAGSPVIMMQGKGGEWPYRLAGDPDQWAHVYEEGYEPESERRGKACLPVLTAWELAARRVRQTLREFRDAGVTVDAVWMDWEGEPLGSSRGYENARHCTRCQKLLPPEVLASRADYRDYCWRLYLELVGTYLSAPAREIFPGVSTTNWMAVYSTIERPARGAWWEDELPPSVPPMLTATNPVGYGNTNYYRWEWKDSYPLDREHVDQFYSHILLRQVSDNAANRMKFAPQVDSFPWVIRWCPDTLDPSIPILSRARYREMLRHIWLRGADGMQIFNASRKGYDELVFNEVVDAVRVYDEMLVYREFLDDGRVMNTDVPPLQDQGVIWSGLRLEDRALLRIFRPDGAPAEITLSPWEDAEVTVDELEVSEGIFHVLKRTDDGIVIERESEEPEEPRPEAEPPEAEGTEDREETGEAQD